MADMGGNEDAGTYKGNDIDTDGDGSVNDAQTLQGNAPDDLGNTIDAESIIENNNGNIESLTTLQGSDIPNCVVVNADFSASTTLLDVSAGTNEIIVVYSCHANGEQSGNPLSVTIDGNQHPQNGQDMTARTAADGNYNTASVGPFIAKDSVQVDLNAGFNDAAGGVVVYEVRTV